MIRPFLTLALTLVLSGLPGGVPPLNAAEADKDRKDSIPTTSLGKELNLGLEQANLNDWMATGDAFAGQPVKGDRVAARRGDMKSGHHGDFWIGTFEISGDTPKGTLTSASFKVTQPFASYLVGGGASNNTRVEIVEGKTGKVIHKSSGKDSELMTAVVVDLTQYRDQQIFIRLVDDSSGGWGHINFDDFRFFKEKPAAIDLARAGEDVVVSNGLDPEKAAKAMTVPPGFKIQLSAAEPDVLQPIAMAMDDRGRIWVAEAYSYPRHAPPGKERDRILIFEDTDGDGKFDKRKIFAEKLNLVSGLEVGFGGVYVGAAPYLLFIPDRDGDDVPDSKPEILLDGWGFQDTHETLNAFIWGPDGWLYGCHGVFTHSRVGKPGTPDNKRIPINAGIWRYHPTRHVFEVFAEGTSNPWGVDFNDRGQCFITACVIPHLYHMIQGGRYQRQAGQHFNNFTYDDIKTIARHRHYVGHTPHDGNNRSDSAGGGHAHSGAMIYLGGKWPEKYRDQIFMNNIHGARLNEDQLFPQGSGYYGDRAPDFLLANDISSQILYFTYGPDGNVFMIDWYDANQCHHGNEGGHDRSNGRIFKIIYGESKHVAVDLKKLSDDELVEQMLNSNEWYVRHARRVLQERGLKGEAVEKLKQIALTNKEETRRLRALLTLHVVGALDDATRLKALDDSSPYVRAWTVQLSCEQGPPSKEVMAKFESLAAQDPSPVVRLYLTSAAIRLGAKTCVPMVAALVAHAEDASDHNLPLMYWYAVEPLIPSDLEGAFAILKANRIPLVRQFMVRKFSQGGQPEVLSRLAEVTLLGNKDIGDSQRILKDISSGLKGVRQAKLPESWPAVYKELSKSTDGEVRQLATQLAIKFGDPAAVAELRTLLLNSEAPANQRTESLKALVGINAAGLAPDLQKLITDAAVSGAALRALASYDDAGTPAAILAAYAKLPGDVRRDALGTMASRPAYALALLDGVQKGSVPRADLTADLIRQLRNLKNKELDEKIANVWGSLRESPKDKLKEIARLKKLLTTKPAKQNEPDVMLGRAVFAKVCAQCHTMFDAGGNIGPQLTGSNRADLDYLLSNIVDPSALVGKDYQMQVLLTGDGRLLTGIVKEEDDKSITLATANEVVIIPKSELEKVGGREISEQSMMPEEIIKPLSERELRSLVAYMASPKQVPLLATEDTVKLLFNGRDLTGWSGGNDHWSVVDGEIVGKTTGLKENNFLRSDLEVADFKLTLEVKLVGNEGNSGIQFRSKALENGEVAGYQADIGKDWWGKLYEEHGRALLWSKSGEAHVKNGEWNRYEIEAVGDHIRTWINGQLCVDLHDPKGAKSGIFALQLHSGGPTEVRFRNLDLKLVKSEEKAKPQDDGSVQFRRMHLDKVFRGEGVGTGDLNGDGKADIVSGSVWFAAPDWKMNLIQEKAQEYNPHGYSKNFMNYTEDLDKDGDIDVIVIGFPGEDTSWFENPGKAGTAPWKRHLITPISNNESPQYVDLGKGQRELVMAVSPDLKNPDSGERYMAIVKRPPVITDPWIIERVSHAGAPGTGKFSHGLGIGDLDNDKVADIFTTGAWWKGPAQRTGKEPWKMTAIPLGQDCAQMYAFDIDGDGDADVLSTSAHGRGIWWHEQSPQGWKTHEIDNDLPETHALVVADMNGDGLLDFVTGKRHWSHGPAKNPKDEVPAMLYWYELSRNGKQPSWKRHTVDHNSGVGTQFEVSDVNGDGLLDIVTANKQGTFYFEQIPGPKRVAKVK